MQTTHDLEPGLRFAASAGSINIKNIRSRLDRWELDHLRALAASLHSQLEAAEKRAEEAEMWSASWWRNAETLQEELLQLSNETNTKLGLTQEGDLVVLKPGTTPETTPPAPGQHWPAQGGTYLGIAPAEGDLPARHLVALDIEAPTKLKWADAIKWATDLGHGARLPTQLEAMIAFTIAKSAFKKEYHWTGTQTSSSNAFAQDFECGFSYWRYLNHDFRVRPFRGLALQTFTPLSVQPLTGEAGPQNFSPAEAA